MKIYKHWVTEKRNVLIGGVEQEITRYGGSNLSTDDARAKALDKIEKIELPKRSKKDAYDDQATLVSRKFVPERY